MTTHIDVVRRFFTAVRDKDFEGAVALFSDDALVESPMGPQRGKQQIMSGLQMMASMPSPATNPEPEAEGDAVVTRSETPMGPMKMVFSFSGGLIVKQSIKMGG